MKDLKRKCVNLVAFLSIFCVFLSFIFLGISTNFSKKAYADDLITQINTVEDFMDFVNQTKSNDYSGVEVNLLSDLDFSNESFLNYYISTEFAGIFNGNGYKLSGLEYISSSFSYLGLFYKVSGTIKNLQISASMNFGEEVISGKAGGLVGNLTGSIDNCAIELNVSNVLSSGVTLGGVVGNYGKNAAISNIYLDIEGSTLATVYDIAGQVNKNKVNVSVSILDKKGIPDTAGLIQSEIVTDDYWTLTDSGDLILIIMQTGGTNPGGSSGDVGGGNEEITPPDNTGGSETEGEIIPISLTPKLKQNVYSYNNQMPNLEVYFEGFEGSIDYELKCDEVKDVGEYTAEIVLKDDKNYVLTQNFVNFSIIPHQMSVFWVDEDFVYDGEYHAPRFSFIAPDFESNLQLEYEYKYINAGNYTAQIKSNKNYLITNPTKEFVITKHQINVNWSNTEFIYNGSLQCPKPQYVLPSFIGDVTISYYGAQINAGNYQATAVLSDSTNFELLNDTIDYEIIQKQVVMSWTSQTEFIYNGYEQYPTVEFEVPNGLEKDDFYIKLNKISKNVDDYTAKMYCVDSKNYQITIHLIIKLQNISWWWTGAKIL